MMIRSTFALALAAVVAAAAACTEATEPGAVRDLDTAEAEFLALSVDQTSDAAAGDAFSAGSVAGPATIPGDGTWTFSFESTRECPAGGTVTVAGSGEFTRDSFEGTAEMDFEAAKTIAACAFVRDDVTFTVNGDALLQVHWLRVDKTLVEAERHLTGSIQVVTSDGRERECAFELHSVFDPESGRVIVSGELCGRPIDGTWARG
ncbi:MAG: hypothetical protein ACREKI_09870 [Gemmatimonadota bacterium]